MPLPEKALASVLVSEPSVVVTNTAAATADLLSNNATCPNGWTTRITRLVAVNLDNAVIRLSIYGGDTTDRDRTLLLAIPLSNYGTVILEEDYLKDHLQAQRAASDQNNLLYGLLDAITGSVTNGVEVVNLQFVQERY